HFNSLPVSLPCSVEERHVMNLDIENPIPIKETDKNQCAKDPQAAIQGVEFLALFVRYTHETSTFTCLASTPARNYGPVCEIRPVCSLSNREFLPGEIFVVPRSHARESRTRKTYVIIEWEAYHIRRNCSANHDQRLSIQGVPLMPIISYRL